jgi:hypothetical protein
MSVTLHLPPDLERRLREQAVRRSQSLEEYLERLAEESLRAESSAPTLTAEQWVAEWRAWAASHPTLPTVADDSRESIYAGRGE